MKCKISKEHAGNWLAAAPFIGLFLWGLIKVEFFRTIIGETICSAVIFLLFVFAVVLLKFCGEKLHDIICKDKP